METLWFRDFSGLGVSGLVIKGLGFSGLGFKGLVSKGLGFAGFGIKTAFQG